MDKEKIMIASLQINKNGGFLVNGGAVWGISDYIHGR
jgi:hypothetical protein